MRLRNAEKLWNWLMRLRVRSLYLRVNTKRMGTNVPLLGIDLVNRLRVYVVVIV